MKKIILCGILLGLLACGKKEKKEDYSWDNVKKNNGTVNVYMWGGSSQINNFMDKIIAKNISEKSDIKLNRVPIVDIKDTVNKLIVEKKAGKKDGSVDVLWVNGENFKALKQADVLWKYTDKLPNIKYVNQKALISDFGEVIDGMEAPFGEAQFNFIYNTLATDKPFTDYNTLKDYVMTNKGRFTYAAIPDFIGSAFVRNLVIDMLGEDVNNMPNDKFEDSLSVVWDYLNEIEPYLWREGKTYPENESKLDTLYRNGEVDVTMGYTINKVANKIAVNEFTKDSKSFLFDKGTLFNNHYLAIPKNASNKEGALYVVNYLISSEAQILKQDSKNWGDSSVLDITKLDKKDKEKLSELTRNEHTVNLDELARKRVNELSPEKLEIIEKGWLENVAKN